MRALFGLMVAMLVSVTLGPHLANTSVSYLIIRHLEGRGTSVTTKTAISEPRGEIPILGLIDEARPSNAPVPFELVAANIKISNTFNGVTINDLSKLKSWPALNPSVIRLWDTHTRWMDLEPTKGNWNFGVLDHYTQMAHQHGSQIILTLGQPPAWAVSGNAKRCAYEKGCNVPVSEAYWRTYVHALVVHGNGSIRYWEIWNEPGQPEFWSGSPETLAEMTNVACDEIRTFAPRAKIIAPSITPGRIDFFRTYFNSVDHSCIDIVSMHYYINSNNFYKGTNWADINYLNTVRALMSSSGLADRPLWNTEFGVACSRGVNRCAQDPRGNADAVNLLRYLFIMASENVQNATYYFWERRAPATPVELADAATFSPNEVGAAYIKAMRILVDGTITEAFCRDGVFVVRISQSNAHYVAIWPANAEPMRFTIPTSWTYSSYEELLGGGQVALTDQVLNLSGNSLIVGQ